VSPGLGDVAEVECLPSGEVVHLGEQRGERLSGARCQAVCGEPLDLADLGVELVVDDDRAQLPVKPAEPVELLVQQCDTRAVDAPGGVEELA
jgi:hypothetical protein